MLMLTHAMELHTQVSFWKRFDLQEEDEETCLGAIRAWYAGCSVEEFGQQGGCSLTLLVESYIDTSSSSTSTNDDEPNSNGTPSVIVQIRPVQHAIDRSIAYATQKTYPLLAPRIRQLELRLPSGLCVYEMQRLHGTPLSRFLPQSRPLDSRTQHKEETLIKSFATFIARGPQTPQSRDRRLKADSPLDDDVNMCTGKVGASIIPRLEKLAEKLPDQWLRERARKSLRCVRATSTYPVVLNHGDLIPSNILVDEKTWRITGIVDWAEAEYLPFGTCLYGLEHLLGYLAPAPSLSSSVGEKLPMESDMPAFVYHERAKYLRERFWSCMCEELPELKRKRDEVMAMRDIGVLLWYGYAWDDGAINRVVNEMDDAEEIACLRAFLSVT
jgi:hypothetical protein